MKTPEEIKKALECCSRQWESNPCDGCPYDECGCGRAGKENFPLDVLTYVKALEAERNAAQADLEEYVKRVIGRTGGIYACAMCKHYRDPYSPDFFKTKCPTGCEGYKYWEWRGAQPQGEDHENT